MHARGITRARTHTLAHEPGISSDVWAQVWSATVRRGRAAARWLLAGKGALVYVHMHEYCSHTRLLSRSHALHMHTHDSHACNHLARAHASTHATCTRACQHACNMHARMHAHVINATASLLHVIVKINVLDRAQKWGEIFVSECKYLIYVI